MLTIAPAQAAGDQVNATELVRLSGSMFLLSWTLDGSPLARQSVSLTCGGKRAASASLTLELGDGRARIVSVFRHGGHEEITAKLSGGQLGPDVFISFDPEFTHAMADASEIARDLAPAARIALANALIGTWPTLFSLRESGAYLAFLRQFLLALSRKPGPAMPVAALPAGRTLLESSVPGRLGAIKAAYWLDQNHLARIEARPRLGRPDKAGRKPLHLIAEAFQPGHAGLVILQSDVGLIVRILPERAPVPTLGRWWASKASERDDLRSWLVEQLAGISEQGRLLAIEMQRRLPLPVQNVRRRDELPSAEIDLAVCNEAGLLLGGWYRDPDGSIEQVLVHRSEGEPLPILDRLERFGALLPAEPGGDRRTATGFLGLVPGYASGAPVLQPRCEIRLKSGTSLFLRPAPQPADAVTIRARALASIPPQHLTSDILERTLAPVLAACQASLRASQPEPSLRLIGSLPARPAISVVIPLYRVYEFLRIQVASFAGDSWFRDKAELIYVLDSPEHEAEVAHLLGGLHLAYGLPMQLVVMGRNGGFSAACNAGAAVARAETLALVNSDIIPVEPGWLPALARRLDRRGRVGAVGPKLLYDDGSLQHAGLLFKRDRHGIWLNHHFHKGMPSNYGPANVERMVPGITGACMVMPRALFNDVGGFDGSYVIGDYEDSDLCLKIRKAGLGIKYVPGVALYHLERQSIAKSPDYTRGVASQHNAWLQTQRWDNQIEALMGGDLAPAAKPPAIREPDILSRTVLRRATAA
ncbi:glycosyltransferase family 2 protein [Bosea caraganae]|uniref:Glycosyltransferase family 2 protein n=1 Tax=Bosea caraganae TaxID=2763117 RepID=A0A370L201_9HYPH|nr:glycosyltransferase family 2 protein [Bosea caraganae]RDJ22148.1 glycosyltransferase family 2 protein [Bosea caraganae]RDJ22765.1 glycosyltransferase family 2 protein [Bosea caraganae]